MSQSIFEIDTLPVGPLETNCYIVSGSDGTAVIIDPGFEPGVILDNAENKTITHVLLTHGHYDHVCAVDSIRKKTGCRALLHTDDRNIYSNAHNMALAFGQNTAPLEPPDFFITGEETEEPLPFGIRIIHTPGHTRGGVCYLLGKSLFAGDTLFAGSIGRTDLQGGDMVLMQASLRRLLSLPDDLKVYPGHGPSSTLKEERETNPFLTELS